jgi:hypothetical protein
MWEIDRAACSQPLNFNERGKEDRDELFTALIIAKNTLSEYFLLKGEGARFDWSYQNIHSFNGMRPTRFTLI